MAGSQKFFKEHNNSTNLSIPYKLLSKTSNFKHKINIVTNINKKFKFTLITKHYFFSNYYLMSNSKNSYINKIALNNK